MHAVFHKALYRYHSKEINDFDIVLFQIYWRASVPKIIKVIEKNRMMQFF